MERKLQKAILCLFLAVIGLVSFLLISGIASDPVRYAGTIASIDEKIDTVMKLTATSTVASAGISAIPGDTATPIAEKLADFSEYFLLILCVLYAEKYLLTIIGLAAFKVVIPGACLLLMILVIGENPLFGKLGAKAALLALALLIAIPTGVRVSDMVYTTYQASIQQTIDSAEELTGETAQVAEAKDDQGLLESILNKLATTTVGLCNKAADVMSNFVESLAVMIVTSCLIPLAVLFFFLWVVKLITGIQIPLRPWHHHRTPEAAE